MDHKSLDVWKAGMDLTVDLHEVSKSFPKEEI